MHHALAVAAGGFGQLNMHEQPHVLCNALPLDPLAFSLLHCFRGGEVIYALGFRYLGKFCLASKNGVYFIQQRVIGVSRLTPRSTKRGAPAFQTSRTAGSQRAPAICIAPTDHHRTVTILVGSAF